MKDADMLEGVQRRATKMIPRLKRLGIFSLRCRRIKSDMIEGFKMIQGIDKVKSREAFLYRGGWKNSKTYFMFKNKKTCKLKYWIDIFFH